MCRANNEQPVRDVSVDAGVLRASLTGEVSLHRVAAVRKRLLALVAEHEARRAVLNLADVPYMDSAGVAVLVEVLKELRNGDDAKDKRLTLTHLQPRVRGLLKIAKLDALFELDG